VSRTNPSNPSDAVDVCLVSPPSRASSRTVPFALLNLSGWVEARGYTTELVEVKQPRHFPAYQTLSAAEKHRGMCETTERVLASKARMVGITAVTSDFSDAVELARLIRKRSNVTLVVGGVHARIAPEDFFAAADSPIDIVVVGDGEETLTELLARQRDGSPALESIAGLVYRDQAGGIVHTPPRAQLIDRSAAPLTPYHKLDMSFYLYPHRGLLREVLLSGVHVFTSYGCPFACTFCANRSRKVSFRPLEHVIEEIKQLRNVYGADGFYIQDETFFIKPKHVIEFCERLGAEKLGMVWGAESRVNQIPDAVFAALKRAGCIQIDFGVESGSQPALDRMKKGTKVADAECAFALCHQNKIRTYANILFNTPGETEQDVQDTIALMERIKADAYGINLTVPLLGTKIYEQYVKPPLRIEEYDLFDRSYDAIIDSRFRLAVHRLKLELILEQTRARFGMWHRFKIFCAHPAYLSSLWRSARKREYLRVALTEPFSNMPGPRRLVKRILNGIRLKAKWMRV
jgi:anaerobic magnesium-protoporphyrin IX monomethyl ester cyclase